jgi:histidinol-phosphate aminotransferase
MTFSVSAGIRSISIFPAVDEKELLRKYKLQRLIRMASNENCYGASLKAIQAAQEIIIHSHCYPSVYGAPLKEKLSAIYGVDESQIILGNGSTELVEMIAKTFLQSQQKCITARETFPVYRIAISSVDARCEMVPLKQDRYDLQKIAAEVDPGTRLIFIANPNNPTGTQCNQDELLSFVQQVPSDVVIVLDEAYREYSDRPIDTLALMKQHQNVIVLRTFSKIHGLAGLRIGYAICSPEVAVHLNRVALPYSVNLAAQSAAIAALEDQDHVNRCIQMNHEQRELIQSEFDSRGYNFVVSQTNFVLLKMKDPASVCEALLQRGILVAPMHHFHIPNAVRITFGLPEENQLLLQTLSGINWE